MKKGNEEVGNHFDIIFICEYIGLCECLHIHAGVNGGQKKVSDTLKLQLTGCVAVWPAWHGS